MELHLKRIITPLVFFKHELDNLRTDENYSRVNFFAFVDENGQYVNKTLYIAYNPSDYNRYGEDIFIMQKMVEERYSQTVIDACRKHHKEFGTKQYEWHYKTVDVAINAQTGEEICEANSNGYSGQYSLYVYGNIIVETSGNFRHRIVNQNGEVLWQGDTGYSDLFVTKNHVVIKTKHDYSTRLDTVLVFDKISGQQVEEY